MIFINQVPNNWEAKIGSGMFDFDCKNKTSKGHTFFMKVTLSDSDSSPLAADSFPLTAIPGRQS